MHFVTDVDPIALTTFVRSQPFAHYMKTSFWAGYKITSENDQVSYVGVMDNDELVGTAVILKKKIWYISKPYWYIPTGMCIDYDNRELLDFFVTSLIEYANRMDVSFIRIDPDIQRCHRDIMGNKLDDGFSNEWLTEYLITSGFKHKGYGYAYNGSWLNRYTLMIDLNREMDTIIKGFNKSKQNVLKRQPSMGVSTRVGTVDDLKYFVEFEWELTKTQGFKPHKVEFFEQLENKLKDLLCLYVTEVDMVINIKNLTEEINSNKYRKDPEALQTKQNELVNAQQLQTKYGNKVVIAVGMFLRFGNKSWDLYTYNRKDFNNYKATDNLHAYVIADMKQNGVLLYDMVGFSGVTDKTDPYYGLYDYKRSFGSDFYENIGEFDYVIDDKQYQRFLNILYQTKRLRRKIFSIRYKKR